MNDENQQDLIIVKSQGPTAQNLRYLVQVDQGHHGSNSSTGDGLFSEPQNNDNQQNDEKIESYTDSNNTTEQNSLKIEKNQQIGRKLDIFCTFFFDDYRKKKGYLNSMPFYNKNDQRNISKQDFYFLIKQFEIPEDFDTYFQKWKNNNENSCQKKKKQHISKGQGERHDKKKFKQFEIFMNHCQNINNLDEFKRAQVVINERNKNYVEHMRIFCQTDHIPIMKTKKIKKNKEKYEDGQYFINNLIQTELLDNPEKLI
ncbi:hypothetical protein TTHERM_00780740 (macronuclear) [Tetrahymena thermophila SB210]|uniref:Uncharacterized protein n=1 Tax=Tetrahymena thermophila (strain SB210) TaxID=312017 RepID=I7MJ86_TETTS|nr:hypothetical protein TTHERM_00780740 [Tetrahymena thermophila SB210]EAS05985.2 hypothetical protein TTHERM_00780740 [Tetrahymena thermophila SB210]|eukprot:XP_001026230.2 hypothetical protein TTHERM_00780740 [Tetrahymena thermophila SB210]